MSINIDNFDLVPVVNSKTVESPNTETLYDLTVEGDHTFFVHMLETESDILVHNCDGSHITSMLIGWFKRFAPNLFEEGKICKLVTPLIIIEDSKGKILKYFFNTDEFKKYEAANPNYKGTIRYLKGLGSWEKSQLIDLINTYGFENFIVKFRLDSNGNTYIEDWLGDDAEKRKKYLREFKFDINAV